MFGGQSPDRAGADDGRMKSAGGSTRSPKSSNEGSPEEKRSAGVPADPTCFVCDSDGHRIELQGPELNIRTFISVVGAAFPRIIEPSPLAAR